MARNRFFVLFVMAVLAWSSVEAGTRSTDKKLAGVERRQFDVLALILADAEQATDPVQRASLYADYLANSEPFVDEHPDSLGVWTGRAVAAVELNRAIAGWTAGRSMARLRAERMKDPETRRVLAMLERRGWFGENPPQVGPQPGEPWENSLGMSFVPVAGTGVLFGRWETRVRDFTTFSEASGYDATAGMLSFNVVESTWKKQGASWRLPGFDQSAEHPVVGVSWNDATAFCAWLTRKERADGVITEEQEYRLPADAEWSAAAGPEPFVWGEQWPPPPGAGNFLGEEARPIQLRVIEGFNDGAARTSRVGHFAPNRFGLYDLAGNVEEWCEDQAETKDDGRYERILRGASWSYQNATNLAAQQRHRAAPGQRIDDVGFRCVLALPPEPAPPPEVEEDQPLDDLESNPVRHRNTRGGFF